MIKPEYYTNSIAKIYHDPNTNILALLKFKKDSSLYIVLINLNDDSTELISISDIYAVIPRFLSGLSHHYEENLSWDGFSAYDKRLQSDPESIAPFFLIERLFNFEINFDSKQILLQANYRSYPKAENSSKYNASSSSFLLLNFTGEIVAKDLIYNRSEWTTNLVESDYIRFIDKDILMYLSGGYPLNDNNLNFWNPSLDEHFTTTLLKDEMVTEDASYEYIGSYTFHRSCKLLAVVLMGPTYGVDSLKVLKLKSDTNLELVATLLHREDEIIINNAAFNHAGDELAIMEYTYKTDKESEIRIRCYSPFDMATPTRVVESNLPCNWIMFRGLHYYNANVICITLHGEIRLFDLVKNIEISVIQISEWTIYSVSYEKIFYVRNKRLWAYGIKNGEVPRSKTPQQKSPKQIKVETRRKLETAFPPIRFPEPKEEKPSMFSNEKNAMIIFLAILFIILLLALANRGPQ